MGRQKREKDIEFQAGLYADQCHGRLDKFVRPGRNGGFDRQLLLPFCPVVFVEFKRPGRSTELEGLQFIEQQWLLANGFEAWVVNDFDAFRRRVDHFVEENRHAASHRLGH